MYSYEARLRAVRLYIKLGKRVGLTIRQLGYPTKNALKTWYRDYEQSQDLPAGYAPLKPARRVLVRLAARAERPRAAVQAESKGAWTPLLTS